MPGIHGKGSFKNGFLKVQGLLMKNKFLIEL
jgi:hypothetical protein